MPTTRANMLCEITSSRQYPTRASLPFCTEVVPSAPLVRHFSKTIPKQSHSNQSISRSTLPVQESFRTQTTKRKLSSEIRRGTDLLADSLAYGPRRKIILESYAPSGFDVKGLVIVGDRPEEEDESTGEDKIVHMNGSILAFPDSCFLWNVNTVRDVTYESLSAVQLYNPLVEYLFIGCDGPLPPRELNRIKREFRKKDIVVEQMDIMNAMGTFNILNGEDRRVVAALLLENGDEWRAVMYFAGNVFQQHGEGSKDNIDLDWFCCLFHERMGK